MLRLRKRHCFRFGFVGYAAVPEDVPASVRSAQAPGGTAMVRTVFHFGISGAGNDVDGERRRFVHAIPTRKPAGANPHVVAGLLTCPVRNAFPAFDGQWQRVLRASPFSERGLTAASTVPDSHRIPYCPVRRTNHDDAKIVFFSFRWSFLHAKKAKKAPDPSGVWSEAGPGQVRGRSGVVISSGQSVRRSWRRCVSGSPRGRRRPSRCTPCQARSGRCIPGFRP